MVIGNTASNYGGVVSCNLTNCIVYFNTATNGANYDPSGSCSLNYCCTTPLPTNGTGNIEADPQLVTASHISATSPCRGTGDGTFVSGTDIDGEPWANPPSIGCDEYDSNNMSGDLIPQIYADKTYVALDYQVTLVADIRGQANASIWDFGDGTVASNQPCLLHAWTTVGDYTVTLYAFNDVHPDGVSTTIKVRVMDPPVRYVVLNNVTPVAPYTDWSTAAANIQDAVDVASAGEIVLVSNGVYQAGGRKLTYGSLSNRLVINKPITVKSVNGAAVTTIQGYRLPSTNNGSGAVRCVCLTNGAALVGFTITNGATLISGNAWQEDSGGGVWCASQSETVADCILIGNAACYSGGAAFGGTLTNCQLIKNVSQTGGGGACSNLLIQCVLNGNLAPSGGGAAYSTLTGCLLTSNTASSTGGGAYAGVFTNCTLAWNSASAAGGVYGASLTACILATNTAQSYGGGADACKLTNCILMANTASGATNSYGGGAVNSVLTNCTVLYNSATLRGGGAYSGSLFHCVVACNSANQGGGVYSSKLIACTVIGNTASNGGGINMTSTTRMTNCIVYYNTATNGSNYYPDTNSINFSCAFPLPTNGTGNIDADPQLAGASHLSAASPCRGAGDGTFVSGTDIDGESWANPPSMGCDEYYADNMTGDLTPQIYVRHDRIAVGYPLEFLADVQGHVSGSTWDFGDGTVASNRPYLSHAWATVGDYPVVYRAFNNTYPTGICATVTVRVMDPPIHYVILSNATPVAPYYDWSTAATNIQDAVDVAIDGDLILVTNGIYATGGRIMYGALSNRLAVTKAVKVQSVNGPQMTSIAGYQLTGRKNGSNAVRCVYLAPGAGLSGFTLCNGATLTNGDSNYEQSGGGVWCASQSAIVSNCIIGWNTASNGGGGACFGTFNQCYFYSNSALLGGGSCMADLNSCILSSNIASLGGGCYTGFKNPTGTVSRCTLRGNYATQDGGGADGGCLINCLIVSNSAVNYGGGTCDSLLTNCTVARNIAPYGGGVAYHNASGSSVTIANTIVYYNMSLAYYFNYYPVGTFLYFNDNCCTPLLGYVTNAPLFVDLYGDYHLQSNSPCINSGYNGYISDAGDIEGNPRIVGGTVDIGAYEYQSPSSVLSYAWAQHYGLPTDGSADYADTDGDGMNNWQEWRCHTNPTNAASLLKMVTVTNAATGLGVVWQSIYGTGYFLQCSTNLETGFSTVQTNITGQDGTTSYTDTAATNGTSYYYRVGIPY